jgi:hypothetical protein
MSSPIAKSWVHATVRIQVPVGGERAASMTGGAQGTGFLIGRRIQDSVWEVFLVTNKHVIDPDPNKRRQVRYLMLHMNATWPDGTIRRASYGVGLYTGTGEPIWREHPDPDIDVFAIWASPLLNSLTGPPPEIEFSDPEDTARARARLAFRFISDEFFATAAMRAELDVTVADEVVVLGYPIGLTQGDTNYPVVRQGIIATQIGEPLVEPVTLPDGTKTVRRTRGFLVDGGTIPGSSGSPVVLKPVLGRKWGYVRIGGPPEDYLLGIIAETRYAPIIDDEENVTWSYAGLGLAFDVETIAETLDLFPRRISGGSPAGSGCRGG